MIEGITHFEQENSKPSSEVVFRVPATPIRKKFILSHKRVDPYQRISLSELRVTTNEPIEITLDKFKSAVDAARDRNGLVRIAMLLGEEDLNLFLLEKVDAMLLSRAKKLGIENPPNLSQNIAQAKTLANIRPKLK